MKSVLHYLDLTTLASSLWKSLHYQEGSINVPSHLSPFSSLALCHGWAPWLEAQSPRQPHCSRNCEFSPLPQELHPRQCCPAFLALPSMAGWEFCSHNTIWSNFLGRARAPGQGLSSTPDHWHIPEEEKESRAPPSAAQAEHPVPRPGQKHPSPPQPSAPDSASLKGKTNNGEHNSNKSIIFLSAWESEHLFSCQLNYSVKNSFVDISTTLAFQRPHKWGGRKKKGERFCFVLLRDQLE